MLSNVWLRTRRSRWTLALALPLTSLLLIPPRLAAADCALIPAAVKQLSAEDGSVDRPFAAPGDKVTLFSDAACKAAPEFAHFSPTAADNEVTLSFEPPDYPPAPAVCGDGIPDAGELCDDGNTTPFDGCSAHCAPEVVVAPTAVADCGEERCFALVFAMPDTSGVAGAFPLTGPARMQVRNTAAGQVVAEVGEISEPKRGCNPANRYPTVFRQFTVLPPRNSFSSGSGLTLRATVDGSGSLLIPLEYGQVLASILGVGGEGNLRLLDVTANLPNGLAGGNGLPGGDGSLIRIPRRGRFLRSYSFNGRPIPPLLEVTGTPLTDGFGLEYGDLILGTVDFTDSVVRISRAAPSPDDPGRLVELFALGSAPGADPSGLALEEGLGPIPLSGLILGAGAAAPLSSLKTSPTSQVAVIARDESLEAIFEPGAPVPGNQNADADSDDRVAHFVNLGDGEEFTTGQAVTEIGPPPKAVTASEGSIVAFLQSEAHQGRADYLGNSTSLDSILRVWSADPNHPACGGAGPCELTAGLAPVQSAEPSFRIRTADALPGPLAVSGPSPGRFTFYAVNELVQTAVGSTIRLSQRPGGLETVGASSEPAMSADGLVAAYVSEDTALVPATSVVWESGTFFLSVDTTTGVAGGTFLFDPGFNDVSGLDYSTYGLGSVNIQFFPTADPLVSNFYGLFDMSPLRAEITFDNPGVATVDGLPLVDTSTITGVGDFTNLVNPVDPPQAFGLSNFAGTTFGDVVDGTIVPDCCGGAASYDLAGTFQWTADQAVSGSQVYVAAATFPTPGDPELVSRTALGSPGNAPSYAPALDLDGSHVGFVSEATNLVPGDGGAFADVFLVRRSPFSIVRASSTSLGDAANGASGDPDLDATGTLLAYSSQASDLVAGDTNGVDDVFLYSLGSGTNQRVSLTRTGGQANGTSGDPAISQDGNVVAFQSAASNLLGPGGDTNGYTDVYLRDRVAGTTERISLGLRGAEPNGPSFAPDVDETGTLVVFVSDATNLVSPETSLPQPRQCYVRDRTTGATWLVSASLGGVGANAPCESPFISTDGRSVVFLSAATNLHPELSPTAVTRAFAVDRLTGVAQIVSPVSTYGVSSFGAGNVARGAVAYDTVQPLAGTLFPGVDSNGVSDVYLAAAVEGPSLNPTGPFGNGNGTDVILQAFDSQTQAVVSSGVPAAKAAVGAGGHAFIQPSVAGGQLQYWNPATGTLAPLGFESTDVAALGDLWCALDTAGVVWVGQGSLAYPTFEQGVKISGPPDVGSTVACVFTTPSGELKFIEDTLLVVDTGAIARDFQVGLEGVAFRTCEEDLSPPADLNGDTDTADCVMQFWDFAPDPPLAQLRSTERVAVPCTFPGCDPFFEPYRVGGGVVSFVTEEPRETDEGGSGAVGVNCLPTSPEAVCDVTGDDDGDDVAVELFNVASGLSQVFPLKADSPPEVAPFPVVTEGSDDNVLVVQLPAEVLGEEFATLPPEKLVTVLVGDPEGDGVFEADGNTDPRTTVTDVCQELADPSQVDADGDGLGADCDVVVVDVGGTPTEVSNDDPLTAPEPAQIAGDNLCDLNRSGTIIRPEVDQIWRDRGTRISRPVDRDGDGLKDAADDRDPDADGEITAVDFRLCLNECAAQPDGCPTAEPPDPDQGGGGYKSCGLLGIEVLLALVPWAWKRRRMRS